MYNTNNIKLKLLNWSRIFVIMFAIIFMIGTTKAQINKEEAKNLVLNQIVAEKIGKVDVHMLKSAVECFTDNKENKLQLWNGGAIEYPYDNNWVFFIDDMPPANWYHPCRYIFVNAETGDYKIVHKKIYPENLKEDFEMISGVTRPKNGALQKSTKGTRSTGKSSEPNPNLYAVIINGCDWNRYWRDISAIYCTLNQMYGFKKENIYVHYVDGSASLGNDLDDDGYSDIDYDAYKSTIERTFRNMTGEWNNDTNVTKLGPEDYLYVFIDDHGNISGGHAYACLPGDDLYDYELAEYVDTLDCAQITFVMEQCHSGGFIDDLTDTVNYDVQCKHRTIHTACDYNEGSYCEMHISDWKYDEFVFYWTAAARGYYPIIDEPWNINVEAPVGSFPFGDYPTMENHPPDYDPDLDGDGKVQMEEAFDYANNFDTWSHYGYFCQYPDYFGDEYPQESNNIGFEEDLLSLSGISGAIENSQKVKGNFLVCDDLEILNNVVLEVENPAAFYFGDNSRIYINGALDAQGTADNHIVFTSSSATPTPGDWDGIRFENSSDDANCIVKNCEIEYADYGIYCYYANPTIERNLLTQNKYGLYLYYSSPDIITNSITYNQYNGVYGSHASPYLYDNLIDNNSHVGVQFNYSSIVTFYNNDLKYNGWSGASFGSYSDGLFGSTSDDTKGLNVIAGNSQNGVVASYYCDPFLGSSDYYNNRIGGYNVVYSNTGYNAYAYNYSNIEAQWNYWSYPVPTNKFYIYYSSSIDYDNPLPYEPNGGSSLAKSTVATAESSSGNRKYYGQAGFNPRKPNPNKLSDLWLWGRDLFINDKLEEAIDVYQKLISKFSDTEKAKKALVKISHLYRDINRNDLKNYLETIINNKEIKNDLKQVAYDLLAIDYFSNRQFEAGIQCCQIILDRYPNTESEKLALYQMIMTYVNDLKDSESGHCYLDELKRKYPNDCLTLMAREAMGEEVNWRLMKPTIEPETVEIVLPEKYALRNNYPNPFNPMTTIAFDLPEESHVTLIIYDISGREVVKLVDGNLHEGFRHAIWDGKDKSGIQVSSGVYLYSIRTSSGFNATKKMVLVR